MKRYLTTYSLMTVLFSFLFLSGLGTIKAKSDDCPTPEFLSSLRIEAFDSLSLSHCEMHQLILIIGAAQQMGLDTTSEHQIKAEMCYNLIADEIQYRHNGKKVDPKEASTAFLIAELEARQYHLALVKPTDWEKLFHYLAEGRIKYVFKRFFDRGFHLYIFPAILFFSLFLFLFQKYRKRNESSTNISSL